MPTQFLFFFQTIGAVVVLAQAFASGPASAHTAGYDRLETVIAEEINEGRGPGISIAVVSGDEVAYARAFGMASVDTQQPLTEAHLFRSASTFKMMVSAALLKLQDQGLVDLHRPIGSYVDGLDRSVQAITGHQLLTHTSGLLDDTSDNGDRSAEALAEYSRGLSEQELFLPPGTVFSYSNPGYNLAGHMIEAVTGKSFEAAMRELVFDPLAMNRTTFDLTEAKSMGMAHPHRGNGESLTRIAHNRTGRASAPSGMLLSTVTDYANFMVALMNDGMFGNQRLLSLSAVSAMHSAQVPPSEMLTSYTYSYGLMVGPYYGHKGLFHTGGMRGFSANVLMLPEKKLGIVLFTNGEELDRNRVLRAAIEAFVALGDAPARQLNNPIGSVITGVEAIEISGLYSQRDDLSQIRIRTVDGIAVLRNRGQDYLLHRLEGEGRYLGVSDSGRKQLFRVGLDRDGRPQFVQWWIRAFARIEAD